MKKIIISEDLQFSYEDLMCNVDLNYEFTLRDVITAAVVNSKIPLKTLEKILRCKYLKDYYKEMESRPFQDDGSIEYLRLRLLSECSEFDGNMAGSKEWSFDGVGYVGVIDDDIKEHIPKEKHSSYREQYCVELVPLWKIADYKIEVDNGIYMTFPNLKDVVTHKTHPSITLIELLYSIFWELSWFGNVNDRNSVLKELEKNVKNIKEDILFRQGKS